MTAANQLEWLVNDAEELVADRLEAILTNGYTLWTPYVVQHPQGHNGLLKPGDIVQVRILYRDGAVRRREVQRTDRGSSGRWLPNPRCWFFLGLEPADSTKQPY